MNTIPEPVTSERTEAPPTSHDRLKQLDRYWRAANYLTIGQIYLQDNPLLREPLRAEHIKPRLLGHWGTSPGLSFIYAHPPARAEPEGSRRQCRGSDVSLFARDSSARVERSTVVRRRKYGNPIGNS